MMSHTMDARIKDKAMMEESGCFGFTPFCFFIFISLVPGRSRKLNEISWVDVAVVA